MPCDEIETLELLADKKNKCQFLLENSGNHKGGAVNGGCSMVWDNIRCWDATKPGTVLRVPCPEYICHFNTSEFAEKKCMEDGKWYVNPQSQLPWTNYNACFSDTSYNDLASHAAKGDGIRLLYTIGYSISLASLIIAVIIMFSWKRLHCKSNSLHMNLFLAFIMRASMAFMKDKLFVSDLGLPKDVKHVNGSDKFEFIAEGPHWECRTLTVLFMYAISASQTWIFMEGLYLYLLIHKTILTERVGARPYVILGWSLPWAFLIPWIIVKIIYENTYCWNFQHNKKYFWILKGPWTSIVVINFLFFLDIIRVLLLRARNNQRHAGRSQYRKFAKFILVLIPLFGIMYIVMLLAFPKKFHGVGYDVLYLYIEMGYNSFQGFILALLFCFLNEDVHTELRRSWNYQRSRRLNHSILKRSFARSSWKGGSTASAMTTAAATPPQNKRSSSSSSPSPRLAHSFRSHPRAKNALSWSSVNHEDRTPLNGRPAVSTHLTSKNVYASTVDNGGPSRMQGKNASTTKPADV